MLVGSPVHVPFMMAWYIVARDGSHSCVQPEDVAGSGQVEGGSVGDLVWGLLLVRVRADVEG